MNLPVCVGSQSLRFNFLSAHLKPNQRDARVPAVSGIVTSNQEFSAFREKLFPSG